MHIYIKIGLYMFVFPIVLFFYFLNWGREKCVFFKVTIMIIFTTVLREFTLITLSLSGLGLA